MTTLQYISDTEDIVNASLSRFQHTGAAAFKLSEISWLPPALSRKGPPGGRTIISKVHKIWRINCYQLESDQDSIPETILDTEGWFNRNCVLDKPNDREDDCATDIETDVEKGNGIEDSE
jgi:hypothetical protein